MTTRSRRQKTKDERRLLLIIIFVVGFIIAGGYTFAKRNDMATQGNSTQQITSGELEGYPQEYADLELPAYPDAQVTNAGKNNSPSHFSIRLRTTKKLEEVQAFYLRELTARDWETPMDTFDLAQGGLSIGQFTKGTDLVQVILEPQGDEVSIAIVHDSTSSTTAKQ